MKHLNRMIVGAVVAVGIIAAIAMFLDPKNFIEAFTISCFMLFCSVVITGGLALVVIVPVVYFFGYVACGIYNSIRLPRAAAPAANDAKAAKIAVRDRRIKAICQFLGKLDDPLSNREVIERELQRAGWDEQIIAAAFAEFSRSRS